MIRILPMDVPLTRGLLPREPLLPFVVGKKRAQDEQQNYDDNQQLHGKVLTRR